MKKLSYIVSFGCIILLVASRDSQSQPPPNSFVGDYIRTWASVGADDPVNNGWKPQLDLGLGDTVSWDTHYDPDWRWLPNAPIGPLHWPQGDIGQYHVTGTLTFTYHQGPLDPDQENECLLWGVGHRIPFPPLPLCLEWTNQIALVTEHAVRQSGGIDFQGWHVIRDEHWFPTNTFTRDFDIYVSDVDMQDGNMLSPNVGIQWTAHVGENSVPTRDNIGTWNTQMTQAQWDDRLYFSRATMDVTIEWVTKVSQQ